MTSTRRNTTYAQHAAAPLTPEQVDRLAVLKARAPRLDTSVDYSSSAWTRNISAQQAEDAAE